MSEQSRDIATQSDGSVVEFSPAHVQLVGKTATERKLALVPDLHAAAAACLIGEKGKVGEAIRTRFAHGGEAKVATALLDGNYLPLAQALAMKLGRNIVINRRQDVLSMRWALENELVNLPNGGRNKAGDDDSAKAKAIRAAMAFVAEVQAQADSMHAKRQADRAARQLQATSDAQQQG